MIIKATVILVILIAGAVTLWRLTTTDTPAPAPSSPTIPAVTTPAPTAAPTEYEASFEIYTNGTKRIFTDPKYHQQSPDAYLTLENPGTIYVKKAGITWDAFFKTLPFSVTSDCLITGTKQTFCSNTTSKLRFYINGTEMPDALGQEIKAGDMLKITYEKIM
jgi:hypothetical protein